MFTWYTLHYVAREGTKRVFQGNKLPLGYSLEQHLGRILARLKISHLMVDHRFLDLTLT